MFTGKETAGPGRPKGSISKLTIKQRELAEMVLGKPGTIEFDEYVQTQRAQVLDGTIPPAIHQTFLYYLAGKPTERIEVKDTTHDMSNITVEELQARSVAVARLAASIVTTQPTDEDAIS